MSDTKTTTTPSAKATTKNPAEAIAEMNEAGKKVALAYVDAQAEIGKSMDAMARVAMSHLLGASKETAELYQQAFEAGVKARESARKASIDMIERSFAFAGK